jgi:hypothetical protein
MASSGEGRTFYNSGTFGSMSNGFTIDCRSSRATCSKSIADRAQGRPVISRLSKPVSQEMREERRRRLLAE